MLRKRRSSPFDAPSALHHASRRVETRGYSSKWRGTPSRRIRDVQLAAKNSWNEPEGKLPKGTESEIPRVSKIPTKSLKRDALIATVALFVAKGGLPVGQEDTVDEEEVEDDVDSNADMELDY